MIQELQQTFHSIIKSLEVLYVIEGIKPCARILVFEAELHKVINFLNNKNIYTSVSDFKVVKQSLQSEFYSDKSVKINKKDPLEGYFFVYASKNEETAKKSKSAEENSNHMELGLLLGYPECCCEFFQKSFNGENADLTLQVLGNSNGHEFPFYNNIAARHFDVSLLSHFPHSFECAPSIIIAQNNLNAIQKYYKELAIMFSSLLQGAVIYTISEGIFLLKKHDSAENRIVYGDALTTTKSKLYYLISSNKELKINDKNDFIINGIRINGPQYGIMIFI